MNEDYVKKYIEFYRGNSARYCEDAIGIKLRWYQKIMLKILNSKSRSGLK